MSHAALMICKLADVLFRGPDDVSKPCARRQPSDLFHVVNGTCAECSQAEGFFILRFSKVRVQQHIFLLCKNCRVFHEAGGNRERRAGRKGDTCHRIAASIMVLMDDPF